MALMRGTAAHNGGFDTMAFVINRSIYPAPGKEREARGTLTEMIQSRQALGDRVALLRLHFAPEGSAFVVASLHDSLADYERVLARNEADAAFTAAVERIAALVRSPTRAEISEILIQPQAVQTPLRYQWRGRLYAAPGKGGDLGTRLREFVQILQADGVRTALTNQLFTGHLVFDVASWYADLGELEARRTKYVGDPAIRAALASITALCASPEEHRLAEVLIPMPG